MKTKCHGKLCLLGTVSLKNDVYITFSSGLLLYNSLTIIEACCWSHVFIKTFISHNVLVIVSCVYHHPTISLSLSLSHSHTHARARAHTHSYTHNRARAHIHTEEGEREREREGGGGGRREMETLYVRDVDGLTLT